MTRAPLTNSKRRVDLMLDSGAFSAWNRNEKIKLADYVEFIKAFKPYIADYVCLDVIPGKPHQQRSEKDVQRAAAQSYENQQRMKQAGLAPIPVFHQGESYKWLERYMEDREPYIGISPLDDTTRAAQAQFLMKSYSIICDRDGLPLAKTHVFGSTAYQFLHQFPMTTADSTSWYYGLIAYGGVRMPHLEDDGTPDFTQWEPHTVYFAGHGYDEDQNQEPQFNTLPPNKRRAVIRYLEKYVGCTPTMIRYSTYWRVRSAIAHYESIAKAASGKPFARKATGLIDKLKLFSGKPVTLDRSIVYATMMTRVRTRAINDMNRRKRLLSYTSVRDDPDAFIEYVTTGTLWNGDEERDAPPGASSARSWSMAACNFRAVHALDRIANYENYEDENNVIDHSRSLRP